jgi:hypothetical protein
MYDAVLLNMVASFGWLGGVAFGAAPVAVDQGVGELLLPAHELEPVRFEFGAVGVVRVQRLPLCNEHADRFL